MKQDLKELTLSELEKFMEDLGEKKYRAKQIFRWIYGGADSFDEMSDLSLDLRKKLKSAAVIPSLEILERGLSVGGTRKYLFGLSDGNTVESVFMKYKFGNSVCVSSQAGCKMGCAFCASGKNGWARNLNAGEMADQILRVQKDAGERVSRVVVMGTGEPFDNYEKLAIFLKIINNEYGLNIGARNITVSTCGLIPKINAFGSDFPQVSLAVSLHAPSNAKREQLMPIAGQYGYDELIAACAEYTAKTGRRITFEYTLIDGKNDGADDAKELAARLKGMLCHVNLILMNRVSDIPLDPSTRNKAEQFMEKLKNKGIQVTMRRELGEDIDAACGQLRLRKKA